MRDAWPLSRSTSVAQSPIGIWALNRHAVHEAFHAALQARPLACVRSD